MPFTTTSTTYATGTTVAVRYQTTSTTPQGLDVCLLYTPGLGAGISCRFNLHRPPTESTSRIYKTDGVEITTLKGFEYPTTVG